MIKNNKWKLIISSIIIMIPALFGIFGSSYLTEKIVTHWGFDGVPDGFMSPTFVFILIPTIFLALHWLCIFLTLILDKNAKQNNKVVSVIYFIIPIISVCVSLTILAVALGHKPSLIFVTVLVMLSLVFITIGNYLPKTTRNRTIGIKIKWTLSNDENWQATHRLAGKLFVITGLLCLFAIPLPAVLAPFVFLVIILACGIIPTVYSYCFYKKQLASGAVTKEEIENEYGKTIKKSKLKTVLTIVFSVITASVLSIILFTGNIETTLGETSLYIDADYFDDLTLEYDKIDSIEYRENGVDGSRSYGFGSPRLSLGVFANDEFGNYTRYTYTGDNPCIVIKSGEKTIVLGLKKESETKAIYEKLLEKTAK